MADLKEIRRRFDSDRKRLNRGRRAYGSLTYRTFTEVPDDKMQGWIDAVASAGIRRGLWAMGHQTPRQKANNEIGGHHLSSVRYSLLRFWWAIEGWSYSSGPNWHVWYTSKGFCAYTFQFVGKRQIGVVA